MHPTFRWLLLPFVVVFATMVGGVLGAFGASLIGRWWEPSALACGATCAVAAGYCAAPRARLVSAAIVLVCGALVVWRFAPYAFYPESYGDRAYELTSLPMFAAWGAGVSAWLMLVCGARRSAP